MCMNACTHTFAPYTPAHTQTQIHTHMHTHTHTLTHTVCTHVHMSHTTDFSDHTSPDFINRSTREREREM